MIDRRIFFTLMSSLTISGFIVICTLGQSLYHQKVEAKNAGFANQIEEVDLIVREYQGKLGVFRGKSEKPFRIIDFEVSLLSEYDRLQLSEGIVIKSIEELETFIEDISS